MTHSGLILVGFRGKSEKKLLDAGCALCNQLMLWIRAAPAVHKTGFHHCTDSATLMTGAADWLLGMYEDLRANTVFSVVFY